MTYVRRYVRSVLSPDSENNRTLMRPVVRQPGRLVLLLFSEQPPKRITSLFNFVLLIYAVPFDYSSLESRALDGEGGKIHAISSTSNSSSCIYLPLA